MRKRAKPGPPGSLHERLQHRLRGRVRWLLLALVALILMYPSVQHGPFAAQILLVGNACTLVAAVYAVADRRSHLVIAILLAVSQVGLGVVHVALPADHFLADPVDFADTTVLAIFYVYVIGRLLGMLLRSERVTSETLYAGLSIYLLLGLAWSCVYAVLEIWSPGSFHINIDRSQLGMHGGLELIYFSFVTMTTLGYGDITPLTDRARSLAILQTVGGQLYLAVMIARLVSMYRPEKGAADQAPPDDE